MSEDIKDPNFIPEDEDDKKKGKNMNDEDITRMNKDIDNINKEDKNNIDQALNEDQGIKNNFASDDNDQESGFLDIDIPVFNDKKDKERDKDKNNKQNNLDNK